MRRAIVCITLVAVASVAIAASRLQRAEGGPAADAVTMRGCVSGSLLKSVLVDEDAAAGAGSLIASDRYRMIGSKQMRAQIKKANKALVRVTGRIKPGPQTVVKDTNVGGTRIGIGVAPGATSMEQQQTPYTPTVEVEAIEIIAKTCGEY